MPLDDGITYAEPSTGAQSFIDAHSTVPCRTVGSPRSPPGKVCNPSSHRSTDKPGSYLKGGERERPAFRSAGHPVPVSFARSSEHSSLNCSADALAWKGGTIAGVTFLGCSPGSPSRTGIPCGMHHTRWIIYSVHRRSVRVRTEG